MIKGTAESWVTEAIQAYDNCVDNNLPIEEIQEEAQISIALSLINITSAIQTLIQSLQELTASARRRTARIAGSIDEYPNRDSRANPDSPISPIWLADNDPGATVSDSSINLGPKAIVESCDGDGDILPAVQDRGIIHDCSLRVAPEPDIPTSTSSVGGTAGGSGRDTLSSTGRAAAPDEAVAA